MYYGDSPRASTLFGNSNGNGTAENIHSPLIASPSMVSLQESANITPYAGLVWDPADKEADDDIHDPSVGEKDEKGCHVFTKRGMVNVGGLIFIVLGVLALFIAYPVMWVLFMFPQDGSDMLTVVLIDLKRRRQSGKRRGRIPSVMGYVWMSKMFHI